jgi:XTP/dITP diphosphohydrolase
MRLTHQLVVERCEINSSAVKLVVATTNAGKLREIEAMLEGLDLELETLADFPPVDPPEETGATFGENARLKALFYAAHTGELTVAEDSGLEIDALGGAPGIESARFGGVDSTYAHKFALLYDMLRATSTSDRSARFVCALALAQRGAVLFESRGTIEGSIAPEPRGEGGFGYDPIFFYPPFGCTLAEAGDRKSNVSHRGAAFRGLRAFITLRQI